MSHIEAIANGLGSQSMALVWMACQKQIPATVVITGATRSEDDNICSDGRRLSAEAYFNEIVEPLCHENGLQAFYSLALDGKGDPLPPLIEHLKTAAQNGNAKGLFVPLFGSEGGRLKQNCTDKWKLRAIRQQLRRLGASSTRSALGIHYGEAARRVKGEFIGNIDGFDTYRTMARKPTGKRPAQYVKWLTHYYPLVERRLKRTDAQEMLEKAGIPYLQSTECDMCPHKDAARWLRTAPAKIEEVAEIEDLFKGEFFFTDRRRPLREVIAEMQLNRDMQGGLFETEPDFGCTNFCGV